MLDQGNIKSVCKMTFPLQQNLISGLYHSNPGSFCLDLFQLGFESFTRFLLHHMRVEWRVLAFVFRDRCGNYHNNHSGMNQWLVVDYLTVKSDSRMCSILSAVLKPTLFLSFSRDTTPTRLASSSHPEEIHCAN